MKKILTNILILSVFVTINSCKKDDGTCTKNTTTNVRSINFFDTKTSSPYYNQVVANFKFTQATNTYTGGINCQPIDCTTTLLIQNSTSKKITFDYNILFTLNLVNWNYQGVAVILAGGTLDIGQLNSNCGSVSLGSFVIQSSGITYQ